MAKQSTILRQNRGKRKTRFNIILDLLTPRHCNVLLRNELAKEHSDDDVFLQHIFKIEDKLQDNQHYKKIYVCPHTHEVSDAIQMNRNLKLVHWNCAYCRTDIESLMDYFKPDNFICDSCNDKYLKDARMVPEVILEDSLAFTKYCKRLLQKDQKAFIEYLKKSER